MDQRKIAILTTVVIVLLGTVGIGVAAWRLRQAPVVEPLPVTENDGQVQVTETGAPPPVVNEPVVSSGGGPTTIITTPKTPYVCDTSVAEADCDLDGLTNGEEAKVKTDPNKADTDSDGVSDFGEVISWNSDPLDPKSIDSSMTDSEAIAAGKRDTR